MKHVLPLIWLLALMTSAFAQETAPADTDATKAAPAKPTFAAPVEVTNGNEAFRGLIYPTPVLQDVTGDGTPELIVGDLRGQVWICRKPAAEGETQLSDTEWTKMEQAQAAGKPLKLQNWWCIGMCPQFVDFNADGHTDIITATFEGAAFIVPGTASGGFGEPEHMTDAKGRFIVLSLFYDFPNRKYDNAERSPEGQSNPKDHMVSTAVFDWDGDGDYDLLLGAKEGRLYLQLNEGKPGEPAFTGVNQLLTAGGKEFCVPGGLTAPRLVDWDGDGLTDLVCGSFKGGVYLYKNVGKKNAPEFAAPEVLIPVPTVKAGDPLAPTTGCYADPVDYDGDGDLDLLVGGYCNWMPAPRELTDAEKAQLAETQEKLTVVRTKLSEVVNAARAAGEDLNKSDAYREILAEYRTLSAVISELVPRARRDAGIWLYRRVK